MFGPGFSFAFEMACAYPNERIGLFKSTQNRSAIAEWSTTDHESLDAVLMDPLNAAKAALTGSMIVAMLWKQVRRSS